MKRASAFVMAIALLALPASGQVDEMKRLHQAKLGEAWIKANAWHTDFDAAKDEAFDKDKLVFAYFTRSYSP